MLHLLHPNRGPPRIPTHHTEVAEGRYVPRITITVGEYLERWLDGRRDVRRVTTQGYRHALKPVIRRLGRLPLQKLTKQHIDDLVTWRLTEGRTSRRTHGDTATAIIDFVGQRPDGVRAGDVVDKFGPTTSQYLTRLVRSGHLTRLSRGLYAPAPTPPTSPEPRGVSEQTVTTMLVQLSAALNDAVEQNLIPRNVARTVRRPSVRAEDLQVWTRDQSRQFREHVHPHRLYALFLLSLCGLRRSEIMGLEWSAVDLDAGTVEVRQGRVPITATETEIDDPKSWRSERTLPVPADVLRALRTFHAAQVAEKLVLGKAYVDDHDLVARHEDGEMIRPEWYGDEVQRQMAAAGVPVIRLKDTRHTAATILLDSGASPDTVAKWLGHDPAVLLRVYAHPYKERLAQAGDALFGDPTEPEDG